jgi:hypothetical protein
MNPGRLHKFVVEKPYCCPATEIIVAALHPIGVPIYDCRDWVETQSLATFAERMKIELQTFENLRFGILAPGFLPMACRASFYVPEARANQAEYWLWRTNRLMVVEGEINPRNKISAAKHNGVMPRASDPKRGHAYAISKEVNGTTISVPTLDSSCKQAQELWDQVLKIAKNPPKPKPIPTKKASAPTKTKPSPAKKRSTPQKSKKKRGWF